MTTSANLDLVRSIYADWERGDFSSSDWAHSEVEFVTADGPAPARSTGLPGMAEAWRDRLSTVEDLRAEAEEFRELDDERILVFTRFRRRGKVSGLALDQLRSGLNLFDIREGKVTRLVVYFDRANVLADLGLDPEAGLPDS